MAADDLEDLAGVGNDLLAHLDETQRRVAPDEPHAADDQDHRQRAKAQPPPVAAGVRYTGT